MCVCVETVVKTKIKLTPSHELFPYFREPSLLVRSELTGDVILLTNTYTPDVQYPFNLPQNNMDVQIKKHDCCCENGPD